MFGLINYYKLIGSPKIYFSLNNKISTIVFFNKDKLFHRENGPAMISFCPAVLYLSKCSYDYIHYLAYYINGHQYNSNGPTSIEFFL